MFKGKSPTFSFATFNDKWICLSLETTSAPWWTLSLLIWFTQIWCSNHQWQQRMQWWWLFRRKHGCMLNKHYAMTSFPLLLKWVISFSFWLIFYYLCTDHYRTSSTIFFNPLNACFLLSMSHVHNLAACVNHNDSSVGCCTWSRFFMIFPHIIVSALLSLVVLW